MFDFIVWSFLKQKFFFQGCLFKINLINSFFFDKKITWHFCSMIRLNEFSLEVDNSENRIQNRKID